MHKPRERNNSSLPVEKVLTEMSKPSCTKKICTGWPGDGVRSHAMYCVTPAVVFGQFVKRQPVALTGVSPLPKERGPATMLLAAAEPETVADTAGLALVRSQDTSCAPEGIVVHWSAPRGNKKKKKKRIPMTGSKTTTRRTDRERMSCRARKKKYVHHRAIDQNPGPCALRDQSFGPFQFFPAAVQKCAGLPKRQP